MANKKTVYIVTGSSFGHDNNRSLCAGYFFSPTDNEESSNTSYEYEAGKIMKDSDDEEGYGYGRWGDYSATNSRLMATKGKIDGKTVEQHRRDFGDKFKEQINFAKYANTPACNVNFQAVPEM